MELRQNFAGSGPHGGACCAPPPAHSRLDAPARRAKLSDLDTNFHCSIIGTCLTTAELRRLIPRYAPELDRQKSSDLDIHHAAVELCYHPGAVAKEVNKSLDTRHALAIKQFKEAIDERQLRQLWSNALASGQVPGAYWALMTHPAVSRALRVLAFGDVHMLSHLVGASNRADIRRLAALEAEREALLAHDQSQQTRLNELQAQLAQQTALTGALQQRVGQLTLQCEQTSHAAPAGLLARIDALTQQLSLQTTLRDNAERLMDEKEQAQQVVSAQLQAARAEAADYAVELRAMEQTLLRAFDGGAAGEPLRRLDGMRIAYIGGRPGTVSQLRQLVAAAGGELLAHDGGVEDRKGALAAVLARAELAVFPVDCISHSAMHALKRSCLQQGIDYVPLRCASVASFIALIEKHLPADSAALPESR